MTAAAAALLARLRADRDFWHRRAAEAYSDAGRVAAAARRDQLDALLQQLPRELEAVEAEARETR